MSCMMGFPNRADSATLSGGSWKASLPLNNLKNRVIGRVARTTDVTLAATQFNIDFGRTRSTAVFGLINNNISLSGRYRLRATNEDATTNWFVAPRTFASGTGWTLTGLADSATTQLGPDGVAAARKLTESAAAGTHDAYQFPPLPATPPAGSTTYTITAVVKPAERSKFDLGLWGTVKGGASFDLTNLTTAAPQSAAFTGDFSATATIRVLPNGWYACSVSGPIWPTKAGMLLLSNGATTSYTGDGVSGLHVWHMQLEQGPTGTSIVALAPNPLAVSVRPVGYMDNWQSYAFDTAWTDAWSVVFPYPALEWEDDRWWSGRFLEEDLAGSYRNLIVVLPTVYTLRYWRLEIDDTTNPAGYVQGGRLFFGPAWVPAKDPDFDLELGWETTTNVQTALGGAETFDRRLSFRSTRFSFTNMTEDEALSRAFDIDRQAGIDQEILWVQNTADVQHQYRRRFLGRLRTLSPTKYPYYNNMAKAYEIKELL